MDQLIFSGDIWIIIAKAMAIAAGASMVICAALRVLMLTSCFLMLVTKLKNT